jgi:hypothetical protein
MKTKTANEKTEYNLKHIQHFQHIHRVVPRQRSIFDHPNLGIPYPPGSSSLCMILLVVSIFTHQHVIMSACLALTITLMPAHFAICT